MKRLFLTSSVNFVASDIMSKMGNTNNKKTAFINTATEVEEGDMEWVDQDRNAMEKAGFELFNYTITGKTQARIKKDLEDCGFIYVSGGNTFYLLEKSQETGFIQVIRDLVINKEKIYIGCSAGSIIAGPDIYPTYRIDNINKAPNLKGYEGYNLVDFVTLPHWGSSFFKELYLNQRLSHAYNSENKIILLNDYQYVEIKDDWYKITQIDKTT